MPERATQARGPAGKARREPPAAAGEDGGFDEAQKDSIEESAKLNATLIYEVLRREGDEEMDRPITSLWWSGVAAGLSISLSLLSQGILQSFLPATPWRPLLVGFGYTVGFLVVVLARHQLFTETTITAVLPFAAEPSWRKLWRAGRLWGVVLVANFVGTFLAALFFTYLPVIAPDIRAAMLEIAGHAMAASAPDMFFRAIPAGFLIAGMVWLLPNAKEAHFHVIVLMTYLIVVGGFSHVIAGSFEGFMLVVGGKTGFVDLALRFGGPVLAGNMIGGTALFALISYGQVAEEM